MRMKITTVAILAVGALAASPALAQSGGSDAEIALLKQQLHLLEQKLDRLEKQGAANTRAAASAKEEARAAVASANAAIPAKAALQPKGGAVSSEAVVSMPNNRPTICSADGQNCISLTSRVHFDAGGYDYHPNTAGTVPQKLDDGVNTRRARIGILGKFFGDWNYALIYDFGGTADGCGATGSTGAASPVANVGFLPGGAVSGIENAFLSYTGFKPFGGKMAIEGGIMDLPYTLDEATSSNDIVFMERASSGIIAQNIA